MTEEHCWHFRGVVLTSYPAQYPNICCHCGAETIQTERITYEEGHGPWVNPVERCEVVYRYKDDLGERPCVPRELEQS